MPPISVYTTHVKEYEVSVQIDDPPLDLRPGMTAEAKILIEREENVLQLPIEAVKERDDRYYCAIPAQDGMIQTRELTVGKANETSLVIKAGIDVGQEVVLNLNDEAIMEQLKFPKSSEQ